MLCPVSREIFLSCGLCEASVNSLTTLLNQSNDPADDSNGDGYTSNAVGLVNNSLEVLFKNSYSIYFL